MKWIMPKLFYGDNPVCVYRIDFNNGFFYIGGTKAIKTRINTWRTVCRVKKMTKVMAHNVSGASKATVTIIERTSLAHLKDRETYHIREHFANKMNLNQSPSGYDNTGLKPIPAHLKRKKKKKKVAEKVWAFSKGVVQFDLQGNYVQSHKSMADAASSIGVDSSSIRKHIQKKRSNGVKGYIFRVCGDNRPILLYKRKEKQASFVEIEGKPIIDLNTGVFYYSVKDLSEAIGQPMRRLYAMLGEEHRLNTSQYRYA